MPLAPLSDTQLYYINQSPTSRKIIDQEARIEASERKAEKLAQAEKDYAASQRIKPGRLVSEWRTIEGYRDRHEKTGRLTLGDPVCDGDRLRVYVGKKPVEVTVRYSTRGALREIIGCFGDSTSGESYRLAQGQRAKRVEVAPEEPQLNEWRVRYRDHKWAVCRGELCAGAFGSIEAAQDLLTLLETFDQRQPSTDIIYRSV